MNLSPPSSVFPRLCGKSVGCQPASATSRAFRSRDSITVRIVRVSESRGAGGFFRARDFFRQINEHRAQMLTIPKQVFGAHRSREEERQNVLVCFLDVAGRAGEDQVVAAVVGAFALPRRHVIERDALGTNVSPAVGADSSVAVEQPFAGVGVRIPARGERGVLVDGSRRALRAALARATRSPAWGQRSNGLTSEPDIGAFNRKSE